jgi:hypothetical protein
MADRLLSAPLTLIALTLKHRETPLIMAPTRNSGATVVPSSRQFEPQGSTPLGASML